MIGMFVKQIEQERRFSAAREISLSHSRNAIIHSGRVNPNAYWSTHFEVILPLIVEYYLR